MGEERAEALPRHAVEADEDAVVGKAGMAISAGDLARQHRPDRPVDVADFPLDPDRLAVLQRGSRRLDQLLVKRRSQAMVLTRSEEHTSELQSLMRISYAVFCLKKKTTNRTKINDRTT